MKNILPLLPPDIFLFQAKLLDRNKPCTTRRNRLIDVKNYIQEVDEKYRTEEGMKCL